MKHCFIKLRNNNKDRRTITYSIGEIEDGRGIIGLYFNNVTGEIEWYDYEWGADKWEDNPRGIICNSIKDFVKIINFSIENRSGVR